MSTQVKFVKGNIQGDNSTYNRQGTGNIEFDSAKKEILLDGVPYSQTPLLVKLTGLSNQQSGDSTDGVYFTTNKTLSEINSASQVNVLIPPAIASQFGLGSLEITVYQNRTNNYQFFKGNILIEGQFEGSDGGYARFYVESFREFIRTDMNTYLTKDEAATSYLSKDEAATATTYGVVKLNPDGSVVLNENGQLVVNGILGQYPNGGLYYPVSSEPTNVGNYSLLISEAKNLSAVHRDFIIAGGTNITLKTAAAAGATQYRVANSQDNRFFCSAMIGGRLATNEAGAKTKTVAITSIKFASGDDVVPYHGAGTETNNDIIITVAETLNPDTTLTAIRGYGRWTNADIVSVGQGNRATIGKLMQIGQAQVADSNGTQNLMVGIRNYSTASSSIMIGSTNINKQSFSCTIGQGHDNSNGRTGIVLFGSWSAPSTETVLAIGDGAGPSNRKNIFEITSGNNNETGIVLRAPNGIRYKLSVDTGGNLVTTKV